MYVHPDAQKFLDLVTGAPPLDTQTPEQNRADLTNAIPLTGEPTPMAQVTDTKIAGVPVRVYRPEGVIGSAPCIVYFHGGGWVIGSLDLCDTTVRDIANAAKSVAVSVDYRLAPEHPFPAAIDDALAVVSAILKGVSGLEINSEKVAVAGDSAGGNIAAVVSQQLRGHHPALVHQALIYPATDLSESSSASYKSYSEGFFLTARDMTYFVKQYAQNFDRTDPRVSPLRADDLSGLPPATLVVAELDPLVDDGRAYAKALLSAGNTVTLVEFMGQVHPFVYLGSLIDDALHARRFIGERIRDAFSG